MRKLAALATVALLAGCGSTSGGESAAKKPGSEPPTRIDHAAIDGLPSNDWPTEAPPGRDTDEQWSVGEKRIIEYESWWGEGTGELAQVEVKLLGVDTRRDPCAGPRNPIAVRLKLRVENVGPTVVAEFPQLNGYWLSPDGRRVDDSGCMSDNEVPTLKPGEWAVGVEREQVPVESGSLIVETAYPFVDSRIALNR